LQAVNIAPIFSFFQLCGYLRNKFDNIEAVGRLQTRKNEHLTKK